MLQILLVILWLLLIPFCCGIWVTSRISKPYQSIGAIFLNGYLVMIALFQLLYLCFFLGGSISFTSFARTFGISIVLFAGASAWFGRGILKDCIQKIKNKDAIALKIVFGVFLAAQLVMRLLQQVSDGDDAYYLATASVTYTSNTMNIVAAYTGYLVTEMDYRHAFASAPIWLAFLSKVTMIQPVAMAHSVLSLVLIVLHYILTLNIGELLFKGKKQEKYLFAIIISLFNVYGYVSIYTAQTFFLTRTWQGKSIFANLFLPMVILLLLWMGEKDKKDKLEYIYYIFAAVIMIGGTAMTTMGVVVLPLLFMLGVLFVSIYRKEPLILLKGAVACVPSALVGLAFILI